MIKGSCDFIGGSSSRLVKTLSSLVAIGIVVVDTFLVVEDSKCPPTNPLLMIMLCSHKQDFRP